MYYYITFLIEKKEFFRTIILVFSNCLTELNTILVINLVGIEAG